MSIEEFSAVISKAKEVYRDGSGSTSAINAVIAQLAAYLAKADLTPSQKSTAEDWRAKLQRLKNS